MISKTGAGEEEGASTSKKTAILLFGQIFLKTQIKGNTFG